MADIFSDCMSWSCRRRFSVWSSNTRTAPPSASVVGYAVSSRIRSPARTSPAVLPGSASAGITESAHTGGSRPSQGRPGSAVTAVPTSPAKMRLARRTTPRASRMQIAWVMASTVRSHSRLPLESSSTRRAFSSAMAAWATTAAMIICSASPNAPARPAASETAPIARPPAMRGAPLQEAGAASPSSTPRRAASAATSRGDARRRARYERFLVEQGPDRLLDEPGLLEGLLAVRSLAVPSPPLFTYVAVRHVLLAAGIDDPELADYLAALLLEFGDHGRHAKIRAGDGKCYQYPADLQAA